MKLTIENLKRRTEVTEAMARFGEPITPIQRAYLLESGFDDSMVIGCAGWIWYQWLADAKSKAIRERVEPLVERGMKMQEISPLFDLRPSHDLFLLLCATFASSDAQLQRVAKRVVDASGYKNHTPRNDGQLYESAWCGMVKHWILGDLTKAAQQAEIFWKAHRFPNVRMAAKSLVAPWLAQEWAKFRKQQVADFKKLWERIRKDRWQPIKKETKTEIVVSVEKFNTRQTWCWAHCGMAMLAHRAGAEVATDELWFPAHALQCVTAKKP